MRLAFALYIAIIWEEICDHANEFFCRFPQPKYLPAEIIFLPTFSAGFAGIQEETAYSTRTDVGRNGEDAAGWWQPHVCAAHDNHLLQNRYSLHVLPAVCFVKVSFSDEWFTSASCPQQESRTTRSTLWCGNYQTKRRKRRWHWGATGPLRRIRRNLTNWRKNFTLTTNVSHFDSCFNIYWQAFCISRKTPSQIAVAQRTPRSRFTVKILLKLTDSGSFAFKGLFVDHKVAVIWFKNFKDA